MNRAGFAGGCFVWVLCRQGDLLKLAVEVGFGLGGRDMPDRFELTAVVEPIDPFERGELDDLKVTPGAGASDHLGFEEAVEQGNSKCRFGSSAPAGFAAVRGNMISSIGVTSIDIRAVGNRLTIPQNGNPTTYARCVGVATEPVFDRGLNRRKERRAPRRQDERGQVCREVQPAPRMQEEAAAKLMIDLLSGAITNQQ